MKIRLDYVTNSSSSSYICDICDEEVEVYDDDWIGADFCSCEKGHYFHLFESLYQFLGPYISINKTKYTPELIIQILSDIIPSQCEYIGNQIQSLINEATNENMDLEKIESLMRSRDIEFELDNLPSKYCPLCNLDELSNSDYYSFLNNVLDINKNNILAIVKNNFKTYDELKQFLKETDK